MAEKQFLIEMGKRIAAVRKKSKMTQEQVAEKIDVSLQTVSNVELGRKAIRPENLVKLCRLLNVSTDYILLGRKSQSELGGVFLKLSNLSESDLKIIEALIDHLNAKQ